MTNWKEFVKKHWVVITLAIIIAGAVFVRVYNFSDWLYFKSDQVRDAKLSYEAFQNGPGELPLLGPRAAGTFLRLGPVFYYFQYLSTRLLNSVEPWVFACPDLLFSILVIPLVFIFARKFFSKNLSLLITALYSFSFIIIQYSRFAWNPNSIPFWGLLFILTIYNASQLKDKKRSGWWLITAGLAYGVVSQLHFMAFVGFPVIAFLFWIPYPPQKINWKFWLGALTVILVLYIPVILSDFKTGGDNVKQFIYALTAKTGTELYGPVGSIKQISIVLFTFLSSFGNKDDSMAFFAGATLIFLGMLSVIFLWRKNVKGRPFLYLNILWLAVFVGLLIQTDTSLKPRFFLPIALLPFLLWGMIYVWVSSYKIKILSFGAGLSFIFLLFLNFNGIKIGYQFMKEQDVSAITRPIFLQQEDAKTLKQIKLVSAYMAGKAESNNKQACFNVSADYERSFEYVFTVYYPKLRYDRISKSMEKKETCAYFSIATAEEGAKRISNRYIDYFVFGEAQQFGRFDVWDIVPKEEFINYNQEEDKSRQSVDEKIGEKEEWEERIKEDDEEVVIDEEAVVDEGADDISKNPPRRVDRVFWKDILK